jgi:hypothetical protein
MFKIFELKMYPKQLPQEPQEPALFNWYFHLKPPACCENVFKEFDIKFDEIKTCFICYISAFVR